ncbi:hypothetical protein HCN44_010040 [Aphidius gifuensis]|uniref:FYVE-type domain-containing protein n=1 Tax=Aphidius gifuensis TaxID=684658 RepID=A0A834XWE0_APHGI|nr:hypothetical protein HCN44_010040 [Aphidius gifuensis]
MEKFAVDLDKVLDDFEFNEDCAEQVLLDQNSLPSTNSQQCDRNQQKLSSMKTIDTLNLAKADLVHENGESVNDFSPQDYLQSDDKVKKNLVDFHSDKTVVNDNEPISLTIHNDITYNRYAKKHQNDKEYNTYDKKLNQPSTKPSVSNVFNSLNEYINASSANIDQHDLTVDKITEPKNIQHEFRTVDNVLKNDLHETQHNVEKTISNEKNNIKKLAELLPQYDNISSSIPSHSNFKSSEKEQEERGEAKLGEQETVISETSTNVLADVSESIHQNTILDVNYEAQDEAQLEDLSSHVYSSNTSSQNENKHVDEKIEINDKIIEPIPSDKESIQISDLVEKNSGNFDPPTDLEVAKNYQDPEEQLVEPVEKINVIVQDELVLEDEMIDSQTVLEKKELSEQINISNKTPVGFSAVEDVSEEELNKYLRELEMDEHDDDDDVGDDDDEDNDNRLTIDKQNNMSLASQQEQPNQQNNEQETLDKNVKTVEVDKSSNDSDEKILNDIDNSTKLTDIKLENTASTLNNLNFIEMSSSETQADKLNDSLNKSYNKNIEEVQECTTDSNKVLEIAESSKQLEEMSSDIENVCELREELGELGSSEEDNEKPSRPQTLDIVSTVNMDEPPSIENTHDIHEQQLAVEQALANVRDPSPDTSDNSSVEFGIILGKQPPFWVPDADAPNCMLCDVKFNVIKRRHHCRACGKVLCNKCCSMKYRLEYQLNMDSRVCSPCYQQLTRAETGQASNEWAGYENTASGSIYSPQERQPNPNNPMEYCSTIPPLQQLNEGVPQPPTVMVPVSVLKREGSTKQRVDSQKSVMFSDGIRPGCDLTELDVTWDPKPPYKKLGSKRVATVDGQSTSSMIKKQNLPPLNPYTNCYIPQDKNILPPTVTIHKGQISYHEAADPENIYQSLKNDCEPPVMFAINRNLYAYVKITNLNCCVNKVCWNVTSRGLACVGQDEVIFLIEVLPDETQIPRDLLIHINQIYVEAIKGNTITELGISIYQGRQGENLLDSREHAGFLFIRPTFQCLQKIVVPPAPYLVGLLVHRWETPWAKIFPLRLILRLGAEYRYYPCPLVSVRYRDAVYFEIGHTIMKVLADFRNYAYTLPGVRGLFIHMEDRTTNILLPKNRYDQVIKGLKNSNDYVLAFAGNFSFQADSHLVCIQSNTGDESTYQTQAINIHNKPRKVTGASFVVINGALKSSMGLSAKSSIVEDGIMVQIMPEQMETLKTALKNMQNFTIGCGKIGATKPDEIVNINWVDNDTQFNVGVKSPIDGQPMDGIPSIRVHNGTDYMGTSRFIRWTEVFIIKSDDHPNGVHDPVDINKLSESIARATCAALVKLLDLLATAGLTKLAVRATIHPENVGYEAGSEGTRLPPLYMNSLDNELIQVLHKAAHTTQDTSIVLELIFHILDD